MLFDNILGIEVGESYVYFGYSRNKKSILDARFIDGAINTPHVKKAIADYAAIHKIKSAAVTVRSDRTILRVKPVPRLKEKDLAKLIQNSFQDYFPVDVSEYFSDYRLIKNRHGDDRVLLCCLPKEISETVGDTLLSIGITPICIDVYENSVIQLLERRGSSLAIMRRTADYRLIFIENGLLCDIVSRDFDNPYERSVDLKRMLELWAVDVRSGYILDDADWIDEALRNAGIEPVQHTREISLLGVISREF